MVQKNFKRNELKFKVNKEAFECITNEVENHMKLDKYCEKNGAYMIYNIYFDTLNNDIIRKSITKPYYKEKLRLRSYKNPAEKDDIVFLELKKKIDGTVAKRRATMTYGETIHFIENRVYPSNKSYIDMQVLHEISDFLDRYKVHLKVYISYERIAYYGKENRDFRVTFDKNILTRRNEVNFISGDYGRELLDKDEYLMEVKVIGALPLWFVHLLSELKVYRTSFSKYGEEYKNFLKEKNYYKVIYNKNLTA